MASRRSPQLADAAMDAEALTDATGVDRRLVFARSGSCCEHGVPDATDVPLDVSISRAPRRESLQRASVDYGRRASTQFRLGRPPASRRGSSQQRFTHDSPTSPESPAASSTISAISTPQKVTWASLPNKTQLAVLTFARLSEPLMQTSLQAYLYHQLAFFSPDLPSSQIAAQAGIVQASFAAAQAVTAMFWGAVADQPWAGRKLVITIGLCGTAIGSLGYGFATSLWAAIFWRVASGCLNGNVGVMRTIIGEIVQEKKYQSRAFLLLPMCFNVGSIIGPVLGGLLAEPVESYPEVFGAHSLLGGRQGMSWLAEYPFALPNILNAFLLLSSAAGVTLFLQETHPSARGRQDRGLRIGKWLTISIRQLFRRAPRHQYKALDSSPLHSPEATNQLFSPATPMTPLKSSGAAQSAQPKPKPKLPFRRIWTRNVVTTLLAHFLLCVSISTFSALWYIFLSTPRSDAPYEPPFAFTGGLGWPPAKVGLAMAVLGGLGLALQLGVYPTVAASVGMVVSYRAALALLPPAAALTPFLAVMPSTAPAPAPAAGPGVWVPLLGVLGLQMLGRTFANPASVILVNNCSPHPSVLGTVHGVAQSIAGVARTVGPVGGGWLFGRGEGAGHVGLAHWTVALVGCVGFAVSWAVREGDGHELEPEGEAAQEGDGSVERARLLEETTDEEISPTAGRRGSVDSRVGSTTKHTSAASSRGLEESFLGRRPRESFGDESTLLDATESDFDAREGVSNVGAQGKNGIST